MANSTKARVERLEAGTNSADEGLLVSWMGGPVTGAIYGGVRVFRQHAEPLDSLVSRLADAVPRPNRTGRMVVWLEREAAS